MNDNDPLEEELRRLVPVGAPAAFQQRLLDVAANPHSGRRVGPVFRRLAGHLPVLFRPHTAIWLGAPTFALVLAVVAAFVWFRPNAAVPQASRATADFVPDSITLSQEVLGRYDGSIVQRPDGEVVRLICYDRLDRVILKDTRRGSVIEHREPQRDIVPEHLDIY